MAKKSRGLRSKTRNKLSQLPGYRPPITKFLAEFDEGQRVILEQEPSSHKGMPHTRYRGRMGKVIGKRGRSYIIEIADGDKKKIIISSPEHLKVM